MSIQWQKSHTSFVFKFDFQEKYILKQKVLKQQLNHKDIVNITHLQFTFCVHKTKQDLYYQYKKSC